MSFGLTLQQLALSGLTLTVLQSRKNLWGGWHSGEKKRRKEISWSQNNVVI